MTLAPIRLNLIRIPRQRVLLLAAFIFIYIISCWLDRPLTLGANITMAAVIPLSFLLSGILVAMPRPQFLAMFRELGVEFVLLSVMIVFCCLSLLNSSEPFRAFRILFPCVLPFLIFSQVFALWCVAPRLVLLIPRVFAVVGLVGTALFLGLSQVVGRDYFFVDHRFTGCFENANQHSIVLAALIPIVIGEVAVAQKRRVQQAWGMSLLVLFYLLLRTGSKTAILLGLAATFVFYFLANIRSYGPLQRLALVFGVVAAVVVIRLVGLDVAEAIDPILGQKLRMIFSGGVENYYSIQSREAIWDESIRLGKEHWLIGSGAGEMVLGISHSHNLVLEYFRGIGVFGAVSVVLLCVRILWRGAKKSYMVLTGWDSIEDRRIWACYVSAAIYVLCNQLSDSFGPTTISALWIIYLPAVVSERMKGREVLGAAVKELAPLNSRPPEMVPGLERL